jgi:hypothetical protein
MDEQKYFTVILDPETYRWLRVKAATENRRMVDIIREGLALIREKEKPQK